MEKKNMKLFKRRVIVVIVLVILILLILFGIVKLISSLFAKTEVVGNLNNRGFAVVDGKDVYYNKYETGIYKVSKNKEYKLTDETAYSMTIYKGNIYYITVNNSSTMSLKRVDTTGENNTTVKELNTLISKFYIDDGYVYYVTNKDSIGIAKIEIETGKETTILSANVQDFVLDDKTIYYTDSSGFLHSVKEDGTNNNEISYDYPIYKIQLLKKWIYYYNSNENALCKIKKDGSSHTVVSKLVNNEIYNVTSDGIYYFNQTEGRIFKSDLKGKKAVEVVTVDSTNTRINIAKGIVYYLDKSKNSENALELQMYRIKENGKSTKEIVY